MRGILLAVQYGVVVVATMAVLAGCAGSDSPDRRAAAATAARQYFEAVTSDDGDRGWSLLGDVNQAQWGSAEEYRDVVELASWEGFDVQVTETLRCEEGYACRVCIDLADPDHVPSFLLSTDNKVFDGIVLTPDEPLPCGEGELVVVLDPFTGRLDAIGVGPKAATESPSAATRSAPTQA